MTYLVIIKRAGDNFFASSPDVPFCFATGNSVDETRANFKDALESHLAGLKEIGGQVPQAGTIGEYLTID